MTDFRQTGNTVELVRRRSDSSTPGGERVRVPTRHARLWFYPNSPGSWEVDPKVTAVFLPLPYGIIIAPSDDLTPSEMSSPLLGLGGVNDCNLFLLASAEHLDLWAGRPWWWGFLRALIR